MSAMIFGTRQQTRPSDATHSSGEVAQWLERVCSMVKPRRFEHVQRVAQLAREIAEANHANGQQAFLAGVLHDLARDLDEARLLSLAPPENELDRQNPLALHGRAARALLETWGFSDHVVLDAVEDHVTGPRNDHPVSLAVYIADVSEPGRGVNHEIRQLAFHDLHQAYVQAIVCKVRYLERCGKAVHPRTQSAYLRLQHQLSPAGLLCPDLR